MTQVAIGIGEDIWNNPDIQDMRNGVAFVGGEAVEGMAWAYRAGMRLDHQAVMGICGYLCFCCQDWVAKGFDVNYIKDQLVQFDLVILESSCSPSLNTNTNPNPNPNPMPSPDRVLWDA